jgi:hypothetical protein
MRDVRGVRRRRRNRHVRRRRGRHVRRRRGRRVHGGRHGVALHSVNKLISSRPCAGKSLLRALQARLGVQRRVHSRRVRDHALHRRGHQRGAVAEDRSADGLRAGQRVSSRQHSGYARVRI